MLRRATALKRICDRQRVQNAVGVITILMVILLGPTVDLLGRLIKTRRAVEKQAL